MDEPGDGYAEEVEREHGAGEEAHAEGVRHGADDGGDQKDGEHSVTEVAQQEFGVDDAEEREEEDQDRQLEADAQAEDDGEEEAGVVVDRDHVAEVLAEVHDQDADGAGQNIAIAEPRAGQEEADRGAHEWGDVLPLVGIHSRRDKQPDLVEDEGAGQDGAGDGGGLQDQVQRVGGVRHGHAQADVDQRLLDDGDQCVVESIRHGKACREEAQRAQNAFAQLFQVLHQAHAGEFGAVGEGGAGAVDGIDIRDGGPRFRSRPRGPFRRTRPGGLRGTGVARRLRWAGRWLAAECSTRRRSRLAVGLRSAQARSWNRELFRGPIRTGDRMWNRARNRQSNRADIGTWIRARNRVKAGPGSHTRTRPRWHERSRGWLRWRWARQLRRRGLREWWRPASGGRPARRGAARAPSGCGTRWRRGGSRSSACRTGAPVRAASSVRRAAGRGG